MNDIVDLDDVATELRRVVDRLNSLPLPKVEAVLPQCHDTAVLIVDNARVLDPTIPAGTALPVVGATAAGAQLAVVGRDFLSIAKTHGVDGAGAVGSALMELRRSLP